MPLRDPTSDMAVIARAGSKLVRDIREKKEASKSRKRFWEMAGSKMGKITGARLVAWTKQPLMWRSPVLSLRCTGLTRNATLNRRRADLEGRCDYGMGVVDHGGEALGVPEIQGVLT